MSKDEIFARISYDVETMRRIFGPCNITVCLTYPLYRLLKAATLSVFVETGHETIFGCEIQLVGLHSCTWDYAWSVGVKRDISDRIGKEERE